MHERLNFYYTNDLHSNFEQWPKVAHFMKEAKSINNGSWLFDVGDHVDRVHPIAEAFMGKANVHLLNELGYNAVTIGNNEGITLSHHDLYHLYDDANFPVVCANLHNTMGEMSDPSWLHESVFLESVHGVKIGVVGLTAPFNDFYELLDWHVSDPFATLEKHVKKLKQEVDIIILLSHLGLSEDQEIARKCSSIDVIIGGHTHHLLRTGEIINNTLITAAGKHCTFVGEVSLTWDHKRKELVYKEAYATDITHLPKDLPTVESIEKLNQSADVILDEQVAYLENPIAIKWFEHTEIMQLLTNKLKEWTNADIAMLNAGLLLGDFTKGKVTKGDVHRICPHPINPCVVELSGAELLEVIRVSLTRDFTELKLKGFGFRGVLLGRMSYAGLDITTGFHEDGSEYMKEVTRNGKAIEPKTVYSLATADTFTFGRLLPEVAKSETKKYFVPEFMRDLLAATLKEHYSTLGNL
ncbi:2',3'-cyclic-nucleotide 2'-phosphodiesterase/5'-or 3'-nucleotidase, 5'-nucleotidase family [Oceanobacillus limi]|uniref:2',3'-cyclic-nucleotide 2'-phosphodiesterase/5'-or 3'-nucleotidase, 5'-nucleotidase family n=1 Tax=Oceanobacillus limi TaxID=930131 RepID=A0A1I0DQ95_9BACI|nr:bifunctional UDP-sugar hydrolase/5'-nucleotidase [Oceanobacillus limi]SET34725.1 2',3'-cyclic-nucleotide 2'-phosphodiesterase/5'-or 3'-nucleotidase, 5'-nucleotidase family [Oceanobacillus limi]